MLRHRHRTCLPHDAVSVGKAASSPNWEVPGLLSRRSQKSTYTGRTAAWGCPGGSSRNPANPPLQEEGWGEQGSHTQTHSRAGPPLQWDGSQVQPVCRPAPQGHQEPHSELVALLPSFQVSCSPRPKTPLLGVGETWVHPSLGAPLSHPCSEQMGARGHPVPRVLPSWSAEPPT